jgi:hypothetical protein
MPDQEYFPGSHHNKSRCCHGTPLELLAINYNHLAMTVNSFGGQQSYKNKAIPNGQ